MKNIHKTSILSLFAAVLLLSAGSLVFAIQPPTANAGPDLYLSSGQSIVLQGSGYDPNGYAINYSWSCDGGTLSNPTVAQPIYTAPNVVAFDPRATYTCTLNVLDSTGLINSDITKIFVNYGSSANVVNINVQTTAATNVYSNQATINSSFTASNDSVSYGWFQYGFNTNYGTETTHKLISGTSGSLTQSLSGLYLNATYHYRAVLQDSAGNEFYGQDMIFTTNQNNYASNGYLSVSKKVINLTQGNLNWQTSVNANPSDILNFAITLQANSQDVHNVLVKDVLPANLIYNNNLTVNANSNSGNITSGINIGTVPAGQMVVVSYQAQVSPTGNFSYGVNDINNDATITSTEAGNQIASATVVVNKSLVYGASTTATSVSTGLTNNILTDSFFLPIFLIIFMSWLYFTGRVYRFADWLKEKI